MAKFQPVANINLTKSKSYNSSFLTYRFLKKDIPELTKLSYDGIVRVSRSKRGQWGEWFEVWEWGKIVEQGWM